MARAAPIGMVKEMQISGYWIYEDSILFYLREPESSTSIKHPGSSIALLHHYDMPLIDSST